MAFGKASSAGQHAAKKTSEQLQLVGQQQRLRCERVHGTEGGAPERSFLAGAEGLPECVQLLTLKNNGDGRVLLRLAHLYQARCLRAPLTLACMPVVALQGHASAEGPAGNGALVGEAPMQILVWLGR